MGKSVKESDQYLSVLVLGELLKGIERLQNSDRRKRLKEWVERLFTTHRDRLVPIDADVARSWAELCALAEAAGRSPAAMDSLIAAQAKSRGLILVTRNIDDFRGMALEILNPWT